jgi:hypothetical protein
MNPGPDVLADLLLAAVEADRVEDTYTLLAEVVGEAPVRSAHGIAMNRLADGVAAAAGADLAPAGASAPPPSGDVFSLTKRLRSTEVPVRT